MPEPEELRADLRALARRNALELCDIRWRSDVARLLAVMETLLADTQGPAAGAAPNLSSRLRGRSSRAAAATTVAVVVAVALVIMPQAQPAEVDPGGPPTRVVPGTPSSERRADVPSRWRCPAVSATAVTRSTKP